MLQRAVRLVAESKGEYESEWAAITSIVAKLGIGGTAETLRKWVRQAEIDGGVRAHATPTNAHTTTQLNKALLRSGRAGRI